MTVRIDFDDTLGGSAPRQPLFGRRLPVVSGLALLGGFVLWILGARGAAVLPLAAGFGWPVCAALIAAVRSTVERTRRNREGYVATLDVVPSELRALGFDLVDAPAEPLRRPSPALLVTEGEGVVIDWIHAPGRASLDADLDLVVGSRTRRPERARLRVGDRVLDAVVVHR